MRQAEAIKQQQPLVRGSDKQPDNRMGAVSKRRSPNRSDKKPADKDKGEKTSKSTCKWCGKSPSHAKQQCPAREAVCHKCKKRGHFKSVCRTAKMSEVHRDTSPEDEEPFMGGMRKDDKHKDSPWSVVLSLNGTPTKFEIDTGAEVTAISKKAHREIGSPPLTPPGRTLRGPSSNKLSVKGKFTVTLSNGIHDTEQELFVVENLHKHLLGRPAIEALDLVVGVRSVQFSTKDAVDRYPNLFRGLGKLDGEYTIQLKEGTKPFALTVPRRVAIPLMQPVKDELARMERLGVITRVSEPTDWCAGMVVVPKSNGKVRICVDLTHLPRTTRRCPGVFYFRCQLRVLADTTRPRECIADDVYNTIW